MFINKQLVIQLARELYILEWKVKSCKWKWDLADKWISPKIGFILILVGWWTWKDWCSAELFSITWLIQNTTEDPRLLAVWRRGLARHGGLWTTNKILLSYRWSHLSFWSPKTAVPVVFEQHDFWFWQPALNSYFHSITKDSSSQYRFHLLFFLNRVYC